MMIQAASYTLSLREREGTHFSGEGEGISPSSPSHALTPRVRSTLSLGERVAALPAASFPRHLL